MTILYLNVPDGIKHSRLNKPRAKTVGEKKAPRFDKKPSNRGAFFERLHMTDDGITKFRAAQQLSIGH